MIRADHLYQWSAVKERWLLCDEVSAAPHLETSAATHLQVSACKSSARAEKYSRYWWCWCLSPHSRHFSSCTLWPCCAQVSGTGETLALQKHKGGGWRCCRRASFQLASRCAGLLCQKGSQLPCLQAAGWRHLLVTLARDRGLAALPLSVGVTPGLSSPWHRRSSSGEGWAAMIHLAWVTGLSLPSHSASLPPAWLGLWVRAEHVWLPCRTQLKCSAKWELT